MSTGARKESFREHAREFVTKRTGGAFDKLNEFQKSQWMTRFYVEEVLRVLNPGLIPEDEGDLDLCFADGPSDAGVDFLCRSAGVVLIIQAKYHSHGKTEDESEFTYFADVLTRLHPVTGKAYKVSQHVRDLAADIEWETDRFELHFVTLGKVTSNSRAREQAGVTHTVVKGLEDRSDLLLLDESQLNERLRDALSAGATLTEPVDLQFQETTDGPAWLCFVNSAGRTSYIGYVGASQFRNLYKHRYKLFALNIRNYVGDTTTNKGIIDTALTEPDNFFFFNNGISAVATKIVPHPTKPVLQCERFSIINGAQTVRALVKAHQRNSGAVGQAAVLVRVTEVAMKPSPTEKAFLDEITKYNNTQNAVKISDFRANDPIQYALAKEFAELTRGGRKYWYKAKRESERVPGRIAIGMEEFAKSVFAFRFGPADIYGGTEHLFDTGKDGGYSKVFGDGSAVWEHVLPDDFRELAGTWFGCDFRRSKLNSFRAELMDTASDDEERALVKNALERRWMVYFALGEALRARYAKAKRDLREDLRRLAKTSWLDNETQPPATVLVTYGRFGCEVLVKTYRQASKSSGFVHRNWFRSDETRKDVASEIRYSGAVLATLPLLTSG